MTEPTKPRRRGCLFYGGLAGVVGMVVVLVGGLSGLHYARKMLTDYTDTKPAVLPSVNVEPGLIRAAQQRVQAFADALKGGSSAQPLVLTEDEINGLMQNSPGLSAFKGRIVVTGLKDGRVEGKISVPLEQMGLDIFRGRYLNGTMTLNVWLDRSHLYVTPHEILANGKRLPNLYLNQLRRQNLAQKANDEAQSSAIIGRLQTVEIQDGKLTVVPKAP